MSENKNIVIENAIDEFIKNRTEEQLSNSLSVLRHNLDKELIVSVVQGEGNLTLSPIRTSDGQLWFAVFTSFEEQLKGKSQVQSMFSASLEKIFLFTLENSDVSGVIINPYGNSMSLNKTIIRVVMGKRR